TQTSGVNQHLQHVWFLNADTGWVSGNNGTIRKTTNGGANWVAQTSGVTNALNGIYAAPGDTVAWAAGASGTIRKTNSGGRPRWSGKGSDQILRDVHFYSASGGFAVGGSGTIIRTLT